MGGMAATAMTTLSNVATILGIASGDSSQNNIINLYLTEASQMIADWCGFDDWTLRNVIEIPSGNNTGEITVENLPINSFTFTGNTTQNSTTVTGLPVSSGSAPNAGNLFQYQSVFGPGIPAGTTIASVNGSAGTLILSQPATATGTGVSLSFGIALWSDDNAYGGSAFGSFDSSTLLVEGQDYWLPYQGGLGNPCYSGVIRRITGYWFRPYIWVGGLVAGQYGPPTGNLRAQFVTGYATIPTALQTACEVLINVMKASRAFGRLANSMSRDGLSVSLSSEAKQGLLTPEVTAGIAKYRKVVIG